MSKPDDRSTNQYRIIEAEYLDQLQEKVQEAVLDDWKPIGGVSQIKESGSVTVVQAVYRLWMK